MSLLKLCPHCDHAGTINIMFGWRKKRLKHCTKTIPQSWCMRCRNYKK